MATRSYWRGFTTGAMLGAAASAGALLFTNLRGRAGKSRIIRLEKSVQIGRPVTDVFNAWQQLELLPGVSEHIQDIRQEGNRSHWKVKVNGRTFEWDAQVEQLIPNQSIGWKSIRGPKHTGRINFSPVGNDTLVHITMNYAPPTRLLRPLMAPMSGEFEGYIESVLRDFKRAIESGDVSQSGPRVFTGGTTTERIRGTGTFGPTQSEVAKTEHSGFAGPDYTAPPEAKR